jgi:hypothetical protein
MAQQQNSAAMGKLRRKKARHRAECFPREMIPQLGTVLAFIFLQAPS